MELKNRFIQYPLTWNKPGEALVVSLFFGMIIFTGANPTLIVCPEECVCGALEPETFWVNCSQRHLISLPSTVPEITTGLNFSYNGLIKLKSYSLDHLYFISSLYLDHNMLRSIDSKAFSRLHQLRKLRLDYNFITTIPPNLFRNLALLTSLDISHNLITSIPSNTFSVDPLLLSLNLGHNHITEINASLFENLRTLEQLTLAGNPIQSLPKDAFNSCKSLLKLYCSNMNLTTLPVDIFESTTQLRHLDFSFNLFTNFNTSIIANLEDLQHFDIVSNPFHCDCTITSLRSWISFHVNSVWTEIHDPVCYSPTEFTGVLLTEFPIESLNCSFLEQSEKKKIQKDEIEESQYRSKPGPVIYDEMLGWYTAATLSGMLVLFLLCVVLDKLKRRYHQWRKERRKKRESRACQNGECDDLNPSQSSNTFNPKSPPLYSDIDSYQAHYSCPIHSHTMLPIEYSRRSSSQISQTSLRQVSIEVCHPTKSNHTSIPDIQIKNPTDQETMC